MQGHFTLIYSTPEKISSWTRGLRTLQQNALLLCCAIDESHCVSNWGNDFRPSYRNIGKLMRDRFLKTPFLALTATATPIVRKDIIKSLKLIDPIVTVTSFDR